MARDLQLELLIVKFFEPDPPADPPAIRNKGELIYHLMKLKDSFDGITATEAELRSRLDEVLTNRPGGWIRPYSDKTDRARILQWDEQNVYMILNSNYVQLPALRAALAAGALPLAPGAPMDMEMLHVLPEMTRTGALRTTPAFEITRVDWSFLHLPVQEDLSDEAWVTHFRPLLVRAADLTTSMQRGLPQPADYAQVNLRLGQMGFRTLPEFWRFFARLLPCQHGVVYFEEIHRALYILLQNWFQVPDRSTRDLVKLLVRALIANRGERPLQFVILDEANGLVRGLSDGQARDGAIVLAGDWILSKRHFSLDYTLSFVLMLPGSGLLASQVFERAQPRGALEILKSLQRGDQDPDRWALSMSQQIRSGNLKGVNLSPLKTLLARTWPWATGPDASRILYILLAIVSEQMLQTLEHQSGNRPWINFRVAHRE